MSKVSVTNGGIHDELQEVAPNRNQKYIVQDGKDARAAGNALDWVDVPAFTDDWTSDAQMAYVTPSLIAMKGGFISTIDANDGVMGLVPENHRGELFGIVYANAATLESSVTAIESDWSQGPWGTIGTVDDVSFDTGEQVYVDGLMFVANEVQVVNPYEALYSYRIDDKCFYLGDVYVSLVTPNLGNNPASSPAEWEIVA